MSNIAAQPPVLPSDMERTTRTTAPPTMQCLSCNTQAQWLPNGQLWCPRCQMTLEVQSGMTADTLPVRIIGAALIIGAVILGAAWVNGKFDTALAPYGLNAKTCYQTLADGEWHCGDDIADTFGP